MANSNNPQLNMDQLRDLLSPYLDGEVTNEERVLVEQALAASPELHREFDALRRTVVLVQALPPMPAPRPFTLAQADVRPTPSRSKGFLNLTSGARGWIALAAILVCIVAAGGLLLTGPRGQGVAPAMAPAEIAVAPTNTAPSAAEAQLATEPAAKREAPTEAPILELAAPPATEEDAMSKPAAEEIAPQVAEDTTTARESIPEADESVESAPAENAAGGAAVTVAPAPAATPSPGSTLMTYAAPATEEAATEQTMSAAETEAEQPAAESAQAPAAAVQPDQESLKQEGTAQLVEIPPTATPLPTVIPAPTQTPTSLLSSTAVAVLTLPAPLTPTMTGAPVSDVATFEGSGWLIGLGLIFVLLVLLVIGLFVGVKRNKGRL